MKGYPFASPGSVAGLVVPASGRLVAEDIPELFEVSASLYWYCHTSTRPGLRMVTELDLRLTPGMTEKRKTEYLPQSGKGFSSLNLLRVKTLGVWPSLVQLIFLWGISQMFNKDQNIHLYSN